MPGLLFVSYGNIIFQENPNIRLLRVTNVFVVSILLIFSFALNIPIFLNVSSCIVFYVVVKSLDKSKKRAEFSKDLPPGNRISRDSLRL